MDMTKNIQKTNEQETKSYIIAAIKCFKISLSHS